MSRWHNQGAVQRAGQGVAATVDLVLEVVLESPVAKSLASIGPGEAADRSAVQRQRIFRYAIPIRIGRSGPDQVAEQE